MVQVGVLKPTLGSERSYDSIGASRRLVQSLQGPPLLLLRSRYNASDTHLASVWREKGASIVSLGKHIRTITVSENLPGEGLLRTRGIHI